MPARADHTRSDVVRTHCVLFVGMLAALSGACADRGVPDPTSPGVPPTQPPPQPPNPALPGLMGRVAFVSTRDGSPWIYIADSTGVRRLVRGDEPAWSPDGQTIAFESSDGLSLIRADGTGLVRVRAGGREPAWSPDGTQILFADEAIRVMQSNGWNERVVVPRDFLEPGNFLFRPAWSADGQQIAFVRHDGAWLWPVEIFVARLDGSRPTPLMPFPEEGFYYAHWSPAWSRDGRSLAFIHDFALTTSPAGSTQFRFLSVRAAYESKLDWSPDGDQLLFSDYSGDKSLRRPPFHGRLRVYSAFVSTGEVRQLIPEDGSPANPDYWDNNAVWSRGQP